MKGRGIVPTLTLLFALTASLGFSQSSGSGNGSGTVGGNGSASASNAGAVANITTNTVSNGTGRQFVQAMPGVASDPGPFPGYAMENGRWQMYQPATYATLPMSTIETMRHKFGFGDIIAMKRHVRSVPLIKDAVPTNNDPIHLVGFWPKAIMHQGDQVIGVVTVISDYLQPEEGALGEGLAEAKRLTHTRRVAIRVRQLSEGVTNGRSFGGGGSGSRITEPSSDNDAIGFAAGGVIGTNRVRREDYEEFEILCLNDGPTDAPIMPRSSEPIRAEVPTAPPPQQVAPPPVQTVRIEVAVVPQAPQPPVPLPAPTITASRIPSIDACDLPQFAVHFDFDKSIVHDEEFAGIKNIATWLTGHPACRVQVEGHASSEASFDYNAGLGRRRSKAVYDLLISAGAKEEVVQFASLSKDRPASEHLSENRRVILRVIGTASGK